MTSTKARAVVESQAKGDSRIESGRLSPVCHCQPRLSPRPLKTSDSSHPIVKKWEGITQVWRKCDADSEKEVNEVAFKEKIFSNSLKAASSADRVRLLVWAVPSTLVTATPAQGVRDRDQQPYVSDHRPKTRSLDELQFRSVHTSAPRRTDSSATAWMSSGIHHHKLVDPRYAC